MAVNLPFSNLFIGTKDHLISRNHFPQIFLYYLSFFFMFFIWIFNCDCGINLVSLLIFGKKSEQFHALFCIGSQILFVNVLIDSIFSFSLFWFLRFPTTLAHTSFDPIVTFLYKTPPYFFNLSVNIIQNSITYDIILSWVLL